MATQPNEFALDGEIDDDEAYDTSEAEDEGGQDEADDGGDAHEPDEPDTDDADDGEAGESTEDVVSFAGEQQRGEAETGSIKELREAYKREKRLRQEAEARLAPMQEEEALGPEPDPDDYWDDTAGLKEALRKWDKKAAEIEARKTAHQESARKLQERWETQHAAFENGWTDLRVTGKDAARTRVEDQFDATQQAMLVKASLGNAAGFIFALGNSPDRIAKLKELSDDPAEFIAQAAVMAKEVQVTKRKPETQPERVHRGSTGGGAGRGDQRMTRLEAQAEKSGDYSALVKYQHELKKAKH